MIQINHNLKPEELKKKLNLFWELSAEKIKRIDNDYDASKGSPVFTVDGKYSTRGWTEWTQGFQFGSAVLQFDATGDNYFLESGRKATLEKMAPHVSHTGVHDHGFNNLSTYGNLLRLMNEGKIRFNEWEKNFYELAVKISGAVQANRWTKIKGGGFIYSFNGPQSLFVDTIRSCRILMTSHLLGHVFQGEGDKKSRFSNGRFNTFRQRQNTRFFMARGAIVTTCGGARHTKVFLIQTMVISGAPIRNRGTPVFRPGHADWRGQC
jgi:hypothetical protein